MTRQRCRELGHVHDRRICWDCGGVGIVAKAIDLDVTERALRLLGWRYLEPRGRMVCADCALLRRKPDSPEDLPF